MYVLGKEEKGDAWADAQNLALRVCATLCVGYDDDGGVGGGMDDDDDERTCTSMRLYEEGSICGQCI